MKLNSLVEVVDVDERPLPQAARAAFAEWISEKADWWWFITLTFRPPKGKGEYTRRGTGHAWRAWSRVVERLSLAAGFRCAWFVVLEEHNSGVPHLHSLVGRPRGTVASRPSDFGELSKDLQREFDRDYGFSRVKEYRGSAAAGYCCKYVVKGDNEWRTSW